jgi:hypothetical protein
MAPKDLIKPFQVPTGLEFEACSFWYLVVKVEKYTMRLGELQACKLGCLEVGIDKHKVNVIHFL